MSASVELAAPLVFESPSTSNNATYYGNWLAAVGITESQVEHFVDFESGFTAGQNLHNVTGLLPGELVIRDTGPGTPAAMVQSSSAYFGSSNPIGSFALAHDEQSYLELDFSARPIDYLSLYNIDHTGTTVIVHFVGGGTLNASFDGTNGSGDSAEFWGIWRNDMPRITRVQMDASGDGEWGVDSIRYGIIPEPATLALLALGGLALTRRRR
jgi:hypothetical protein